jgi:ubiquinone/menaquinone biosynthesis C-methylase UbiE
MTRWPSLARVAAATVQVVTTAVPRGQPAGSPVRLYNLSFAMTCSSPTRLAAALLFVTLGAPVITSGRQSDSTIRTARILEALDARRDLTVCEIGAGNGELTLEAARLVGPSGHIYTSEIGDDRVRSLRERVATSRLAQITVVTGDPVQTNFPPAACDALFMRNVYHHFADPAAMNASIAAALKPGGRVAVVDFTPPDDEASSPADRDNDGTHGVAQETVTRELQAAGFVPIATERGTGRWFMVVASKPAP